MAYNGYSRSRSKRGNLAFAIAKAINPDPRETEAKNIRALLARESADFATSERLRTRLTQLTKELH